MGHQIIKQPNGLYSVFSTITENFVLVDSTPQDIVDDLVSEYREQMTERVAIVVEALEKGEEPYYQFTMSYEEALRRVKENQD